MGKAEAPDSCFTSFKWNSSFLFDFLSQSVAKIIKLLHDCKLRCAVIDLLKIYRTLISNGWKNWWNVDRFANAVMKIYHVWPILNKKKSQSLSVWLMIDWVNLGGTLSTSVPYYTIFYMRNVCKRARLKLSIGTFNSEGENYAKCAIFYLL